MVVVVTATTTAGRALPPAQATRALAAAQALQRGAEDRRLLDAFVAARMHRVAPNLAALVGTAVAARLVGAAGGLQALARMPACNLQVLGAKRGRGGGGGGGGGGAAAGGGGPGPSAAGVGGVAVGLSSAANRPAQSCALAECPIVVGAPPALRTRAVRVIAAKCALLARVDAHNLSAAAAPVAGGSNGNTTATPDDRAGAAARDDVLKKLTKWQEPPPARIVKPLAVPDAGEKKARRGGRRHRKMKEAYGATSLRQAANRTAFDFNRGEEEYLDGDEVVGLGTLGQREGAGRLRVVARAQKVKLSREQQRKLQRQTQQQQQGRGGGVSGFATGMATALNGGGGGFAGGGGSSGVGGMVSSLTFTPAQGIQLVDPALAGGGVGGAGGSNPSRVGGRAGTESSFFAENAGFKSVVPRGL